MSSDLTLDAAFGIRHNAPKTGGFGPPETYRYRQSTSVMHVTGSSSVPCETEKVSLSASVSLRRGRLLVLALRGIMFFFLQGRKK